MCKLLTVTQTCERGWTKDSNHQKWLFWSLWGLYNKNTCCSIFGWVYLFGTQLLSQWRRWMINACSWTLQIFIFLKERNIYMMQYTCIYNICTVRKKKKKGGMCQHSAFNMQHAHSVDSQTLQPHIWNMERQPLSRLPPSLLNTAGLGPSDGLSPSSYKCMSHLL
jgi:hypothetical protein